MNFPPKAISVMLLVQCLFIGMGYALARKMTRFIEQADLPAVWLRAMPQCVEFVLSIGLWALLIPLLWASWVCLRSEVHRGMPLTQSVDARITIGLTVVIVCIWSYAAAQALNTALSFHGPVTVISHSN